MNAKDTLNYIKDNLELVKTSCFSLGGGVKEHRQLQFKNNLARLIPELESSSWKSIYNAFEELDLINVIKPLPGSSYTNDLYIFFPKDHNIYTISNIIYIKSYFSNYTALSINQLTYNKTNTIYMKRPLKKPSDSFGVFSQKSIDISFSKPMRKSKEITYIYWNENHYNIIFLEGLNPVGINDYMLSFTNGLLYSDIELTLLDSIIRPGYSGGFLSILDAFKSAKNTLSVERLAILLNMFNYSYPYNRNVSMYMKLAGFNRKEIDFFNSLVNKKEAEYDFYIEYQMTRKEYDKEFKIYYPFDVSSNEE